MQTVFRDPCVNSAPKTPWVDELDRANEITDSLGVHALQLLPELSDQDIGKMQEDNPALGPVRSFLLDDVQPTPDDLRALLLTAGSCGRSAQP